MTASAAPMSVRFDLHSMWFEAVILSPSGPPWEALDEDVSIAGLLAGRGNTNGIRD